MIFFLDFTRTIYYFILTKLALVMNYNDVHGKGIEDVGGTIPVYVSVQNRDRDEKFLF